MRFRIFPKPKQEKSPIVPARSGEKKCNCKSQNKTTRGRPHPPRNNIIIVCCNKTSFDHPPIKYYAVKRWILKPKVPAIKEGRRENR